MDAGSVLEAIDAKRAETRRWAERALEEIEARRDSDLDKLDRAARAMAPDDQPTAGAPPRQATSEPEPDTRPTTKKRVRRKRLRPASQKEMGERCDQIARLLAESRDGLPYAAIRDTLGLTSNRTRTGILMAIEKGLIETEGTGTATRYVSATAGSGPLSRQAPTQGTVDERIVVVLEDRFRATTAELAQALRKPLEEVIDACGRLQSEERIRMDRHNGRPVYVLPVRV